MFTNFITGTGFMKCIPMKFWGLETFAASLVMEMLEVFEARTISSAQGSSLMRPSIFWKIEDFNSYDSLTASMMNSLSLVRLIPTPNRNYSIIYFVSKQEIHNLKSCSKLKTLKFDRDEISL